MSSDTSPSGNPFSRAPQPPGLGEQAFGDVFSAVYEELRSLASALKRDGGTAMLATTDVVNEAYLRLQSSPEVSSAERLTFKRAAARAMRHLLVRAARRRSESESSSTDTPPTEQLVLMTLGPTPDAATISNQRVLGLDRAIQELSMADSTQADILEMKYFGGLSNSEMAEILGIREAAVQRDLRVAEAWLKMRLSSKA